MKILSAIAAALLVSVLVVSCSHPTTTNPGTPPSSGRFTVAASVDGVAYSAGATMTVTQIPPNYWVVVQSTASGNRSMTLTFKFPTNSTFPPPKNLTLSQFTGTYSESSVATWPINTDSAATITINSFTYSYADTTFSADFSFKASGGIPSGIQSTKTITGGTVRTN